jgi:hypothetical protein
MKANSQLLILLSCFLVRSALVAVIVEGEVARALITSSITFGPLFLLWIAAFAIGIGQEIVTRAVIVQLSGFLLVTLGLLTAFTRYQVSVGLMTSQPMLESFCGFLLALVIFALIAIKKLRGSKHASKS